MQRHLGKLAAAAVLALAASTAQAQTSLVKPWSLGITAGATLPTGDLGDLQGTGFNVGGLLDVRSPAIPVGLRLDAAMHQFSGKDVTIGAVSGETADLRVINVNGNATLDVPGFVVFRPYVIGGLGLYRSQPVGDDIDVDAENDLGFNIGGGFRWELAGFGALIEARFHYIPQEKGTGNPDGNAVTFLPIVFGLTF